MNIEEEPLSIQNCKEILQNKYSTKNAVVLDVKISKFKELGMMAQYYKITILGTVNDENVRTIVFGKKTTDNIQSVMAKMQGAFEKEIFMYNTMRKEFKKIPKFKFSCMTDCYLALGDSFVALDDLSELGYKNAGNFLDTEHLTLGLKTVAEFHAATILLEHKKSNDMGKTFSIREAHPRMFLDPFYREDKKFLGYKWLQNSIHTIERMFDYLNLYPDQRNIFKNRLREEAKRIFEITVPSNKHRNVICHGDLWSSNLLFQYESSKPVKCKLIDFQALRYNPPASDVLNFIYEATDKDYRDKNMENLLDLYYNELFSIANSGGVNLQEQLPRKQFQKSCEYIMPQIIIQYASFSHYLMIFDEPELLSNPDKFKKFVYEDRFEYVKDGYEKYDTYKTRIDESMNELFHFLVKP